MTISELLTLAGLPLDDFSDLDLGYRPTFGTAELRAAVAASYHTIAPDNVLTSAGAQEALCWVLAKLLSDGGHAVVGVPNYQSLESVPLASSAEVSGLQLWHGTGSELRWALDLERLESLLRPDTRVVAVNFPNNPTGFIPDRASFVALAQLCHERGIVLVSDEVGEIEGDPTQTLPQAADLTPTAVSINVMSKSYGLPGLRAGWIATQDQTLLVRLEHCKHYTSICNPGVTEHLAAVALGVGDSILARNRAIVANNVVLVRDFFARYPELFEFEALLGGWVALPRYLGSDGVGEFSRRAIEEAGILTLPASLYRSGLLPVPTDRFRIGFGRSNMAETLKELRRHLGIRFG